MFSELVDEAVSRSRRADKQADIISYANQTLRELQSQQNGAFTRDMIETQISVAQNQPQPITWDRPPHFRIMRAVAYTDTQNFYDPIYPKFIRPGSRQKETDYFYYGAGSYFVFAGVGQPQGTNGNFYLGSLGATNISLAYYTKFRRYQYYAVGARPAVYDRNAESWGNFVLTSFPNPPPDISDVPSILPQSNTFNLQQQYAIYLVCNWLLFDYYDTVLEGTLAKLFKNVGDNRSTSSFALYKSLETRLIADESFESLILS